MKCSMNPLPAPVSVTEPENTGSSDPLCLDIFQVTPEVTVSKVAPFGPTVNPRPALLRSSVLVDPE